VFFVLIYLFFPETKGRTLEEIAEIFDGKGLPSAAEELKMKIELAEDDGLEKDPKVLAQN